MAKYMGMKNDEEEQKLENGKRKKYDLEERTARFAEEIIAFAKRIPKRPETLPLIGQLVSSGTSVGANYCEADDAHSKKDFHHRIGVCKREAKETKYWLRMIGVAEPSLKVEAAPLVWRQESLISYLARLTERNELWAGCPFLVI